MAGSVSECEPEGAPIRFTRSLVEVQAELVGVRTQTHGVHLVLRLVPDPGVDHVRREHVAAEQELWSLRAARAPSSEPGVVGTFFISSGARS